MDSRWESARRITLIRDGYKCLLCFEEATDVHHRRAKGMGGTSDPDVKYGLANLISLCRFHHSWVHGHVKESRQTGLIVPSWENPEDVPLTIKPGLFCAVLTKDGDMKVTSSVFF